jgi:hypothetical protein
MSTTYGRTSYARATNASREQYLASAQAWQDDAVKARLAGKPLEAASCEANAASCMRQVAGMTS